MQKKKSAPKLNSSSISLVYKKGKKIHTKDFVFFYKFNLISETRICISLNSKIYRSSVSRNRTKRKIKALINNFLKLETNKTSFKGIDIILSPKINFLHFKTESLLGSITQSLFEIKKHVTTS